jgi:hypothetical protein
MRKEGVVSKRLFNSPPRVMFGSALGSTALGFFWRLSVRRATRPEASAEVN